MEILTCAMNHTENEVKSVITGWGPCAGSSSESLGHQGSPMSNSLVPAYLKVSTPGFPGKSCLVV